MSEMFRYSVYVWDGYERLLISKIYLHSHLPNELHRSFRVGIKR